MKKIILSISLISSLAHAMDEDGDKIRLTGAIPLSLEQIFNPNPQLEVTLNYYISTYPHTDYAKLNTSQKESLLKWARETQLLDGLVEEGTALRIALETPAQADLGVDYTFTYFKTTYPSSDFGHLPTPEEKEVILLAKVIKDRCGFTSPGCLNMAMRVPLKEFFDVREKIRKDSRSESSKVWNDDVKPWLKKANNIRKKYI